MQRKKTLKIYSMTVAQVNKNKLKNMVNNHRSAKEDKTISLKINKKRIKKHINHRNNMTCSHVKRKLRL
jgi:predicted transcriptional regulator